MLEKKIIDYVLSNDMNQVAEEIAMEPEFIGMQIYGEPIMGVASADDPIFQEYRDKQEVTYGHFLPPKEWLPSALSVISVFLPYTDRIKAENAEDLKKVSGAWLHGRYEGQIFLREVANFLKSLVEDMGYEAIIPPEEAMMKISSGKDDDGVWKTFLSNEDFWSSWSERHVAYAAGLGTFGLSKNLLSENGAAGRYLSIVTDMPLEPTERKYEKVYEYCTMCGDCVRNCPANAIHMDTGKDHIKCSKYLNWIKKHHAPRYGCGKCQVAVACQDHIPDH